MSCRCPACPCPCQHAGPGSPKPVVAPTNFLSIQYLNPSIVRVCNLFEYLMVTEQKSFDRSYACDEYLKLLEFANNFSESPFRTMSPITEIKPTDTYDVYDDVVERIYSALNGYLKKCKDLLVLRDDPIAASAIFPLTISEALKMGL